MRVLLVEDPTAAAQSIEGMLKAEGFFCDRMDFSAAYQQVDELSKYDLILLDLPLAEIDGQQLIRRLRTTLERTPILILSDLDEPDSIIKGLDLGADDYVTRPFDQSQLISRMHIAVGRLHGHSASVIRTGNIEVNLFRRTVQVNGLPVHITGREFGVLELLSVYKGTTVTKDTILNHLYAGMVEPDLKIIDVFMCTLRRKLSEAGVGEDYIKTVWGLGYVMNDPPEISGTDVQNIVKPPALSIV